MLMKVMYSNLNILCKFPLAVKQILSNPENSSGNNNVVVLDDITSPKLLGIVLRGSLSIIFSDLLSDIFNYLLINLLLEKKIKEKKLIISEKKKKFRMTFYIQTLLCVDLNKKLIRSYFKESYFNPII
jgi:hypothetical protein